MAVVTSFLNRGIPCDLGCSGVGGVTLCEALADFASYRDDCKRYGNEWREAFLIVTFDRPSSEAERTYEFGPRGGIHRVQ